MKRRDTCPDAQSSRYSAGMPERSRAASFRYPRNELSGSRYIIKYMGIMVPRSVGVSSNTCVGVWRSET